MRIFLFLLTIFIFSCGQEQKADGDTKAKTETKQPLGKASQAGSTLPPSSVKTYPSVTQEIMDQIWQKCDQVDYIFYKENFSMSLNEKPSIQQLVKFVSTEPAPIPKKCKSAGRITFNGDGEMLAEAEFYYSDECRFFVFLENNKPTYSNYITPQGYQHYDQIFKNLQTQSQQIRNQAKQSQQ